MAKVIKKDGYGNVLNIQGPDEFQIDRQIMTPFVIEREIIKRPQHALQSKVLELKSIRTS